MRPPSRKATAVGAIFATLLLVFLVLNLISPEKKINQRIPHVAATGDAEFLRAMGSLLGPPLVEGNRDRTRRGTPALAALIREDRSGRLASPRRRISSRLRFRRAC
jgi:cardiolipin synthase A/B